APHRRRGVRRRAGPGRPAPARGGPRVRQGLPGGAGRRPAAGAGHRRAHRLDDAAPEEGAGVVRGERVRAGRRPGRGAQGL
ncbi:MAG: hypothetical protein AVDCRST_MAG66-3404, partial [uncultured Pseudonocardia sp.]